VYAHFTAKTKVGQLDLELRLHRGELLHCSGTIAFMRNPVKPARHSASPASVAPPLLVELREQHKVLILQHLLGLSGDDRRLRFGTPASDLAIERYVDSLDFAGEVVLGLVDEGGRLLGFGHLVHEAPTPEFGISIDRSARSGGLGSLLLARACGHVREAGRDRLVMHYLPENVALARLAARAGMRLDVVEGEGRASLTLPPLGDVEAPSRLAADLGQAVELAFRLAAQDRDAADRLTSA
jgi:GNAT superfamily N-acetyltransferase